jgi:hypothetical protein
LWLAALLFALPFEPRRTLPLGGLEVTWLEAIAAPCCLALLLLLRGEVKNLLRARPLPLLLVGAYAAAHVVSAAVAREHQIEAGKFALRMCVAAGFAAIVAVLPRATLRAGLFALAATSIVVAALAIVEGAGSRSLDPLLNVFREAPFNVGGARRATAGSEYPNQAAAFLMHGLVVWTGLAGAACVRMRWLAPIVAALSLGLLFTYSRGALAAAAAAVAAMLAIGRLGRLPLLTRAAAICLGVLTLSALAFAGAREIFRLRLGGEGTDAWYAARYQPAERSLRLRPGEERRTSLTVTNLGAKTWTDREAFHLSYHWYDIDARTLTDGDRTRLPRDVARGDSVQLTPLVVAPRKEGRYLLVWDMVHEETTWFSGQGVRPASAPVVVGQVPGGTSEPPADMFPAAAPGWRPGRFELWALALQMWRERPLLGVGPDNFRRLYGRFAGQGYWDTRIFANNLLLEAAATVGSLGALALLGTLGSAGWAAFRRSQTAPPDDRPLFVMLLALVAALAAHGAIDYVLAFTGHYLWFGFVIGAVSSFDRRQLGVPRR